MYRAFLLPINSVGSSFCVLIELRVDFFRIDYSTNVYRLFLAVHGPLDILK